jgi:Na+-translocating ferredoxin:NAD+ oxidoreductase subunit B
MAAQVKEEECTGCGDCLTACPIDGVVVMESEKAAVKPDDCIECNACVDACPSGAMTIPK